MEPSDVHLKGLHGLRVFISFRSARAPVGHPFLVVCVVSPVACLLVLPYLLK